MIADRTLSEIGSKPLGKVRRPKLTYHRNPSLKQERHPFHSRKSMLKRRALRHQWQPIFVIAAPSARSQPSGCAAIPLNLRPEGAF